MGALKGPACRNRIATTLLRAAGQTNPSGSIANCTVTAASQGLEARIGGPDRRILEPEATGDFRVRDDDPVAHLARPDSLVLVSGVQ